MGTLTAMVKLHTIKHDKKIKQICSPLDLLGISTFGYYAIKSDESFGNICNFAAEHEFYYSQNLICIY